MSIYNDPHISSYENLWGLQLRRNEVLYDQKLIPEGTQRTRVYFKTPNGREHIAREDPTIVETRKGAVASLILSPFWITAKVAANVLSSLLNIITLGSISVQRSNVEDSFLGRLKGVGCSLLSLVTTPANIAIEIAATVSHVAKPTANKVDLLATHMWTGFVMAGKDLQPPQDLMYMGPQNKDR